jgi:hypothetical protein
MAATVWFVCAKAAGRKPGDTALPAAAGLYMEGDHAVMPVQGQGQEPAMLTTGLGMQQLQQQPPRAW